MPAQSASSRRVSAGTPMSGMLTSQSLGEAQQRSFLEFTIPKSATGFEWAESGFGDSCLTFCMVELTPDEESRATTNAGPTNLMGGFNEMVKASIYKIGGSRANYDMRGNWLRAIGPGARKIVDKCFNKLNGVEEGLGEDVLASAKPGRG